MKYKIEFLLLFICSVSTSFAGATNIKTWVNDTAQPVTIIEGRNTNNFFSVNAEESKDKSIPIPWIAGWWETGDSIRVRSNAKLLYCIFQLGNQVYYSNLECGEDCKGGKCLSNRIQVEREPCLNDQRSANLGSDKPTLCTP